MTRTLTTLALLLALAACGSDDESPTPEEHRAAVCERNNIAPDTCALVTTKETFSCQHGPWRYAMRRDGWAVRLDCSVGGEYDDAQLAGAFRRWVPTPDTNLTLLNLATDGSEWPRAECLLEPLVYATDSLNQSTPDKAQVEVTLSVAADGMPSLASNDPVFAASFNFAPSECVRTALTVVR